MEIHFLLSGHLMNNYWCILDWNVRGINSQTRWDDIYRIIEESNCNVICLQETKREEFDQAYIRNFCPRKFNQFAYVPSIGNSGGLIIIWVGSQFSGKILNQHQFEITVELTCSINREIWFVTNIYGPTNTGGRTLFTNWMLSLNCDDYNLWIFMGVLTS
jgi:exonuclease III